MTEVSAKPWTSKDTGQPITLYSFKIQGSNRWFRHGTTEMPFREGDVVSFVNDPQGNVDIPVQVGNAGAAPAQPAPPPAGNANRGRAPASGGRPAGGGSGGSSRDDYWKQKEERDIEKERKYQEVDVPRMSFSASQDRAVNLVSAALEGGALSFGNASVGKRLDMLLEYVDQVTDRFFLQSMDAGAHLMDLQQNRDLNEVVDGQPAEEQEDY